MVNPVAPPSAPPGGQPGDYSFIPNVPVSSTAPAGSISANSLPSSATQSSSTQATWMNSNAPHLKTNPGDPPSVLNQQQMDNARTIVAVGKAAGMPDQVIISALAVANDESTFLNYANSTVPESFNFPHQAVGSDHDSVGVFQQRANQGTWGANMQQLMDVAHQAAAYYGIAPDATSPGVLQTKGWQNMSPGELAQAVQQSGTPSAYYPLVQFGQNLFALLKNTPPAVLGFVPRATGPLYTQQKINQLQQSAQAPPPAQTGPNPQQQANQALDRLAKANPEVQRPAASPPAQAAAMGAGATAPPPPTFGKAPAKFQ